MWHALLLATASSSTELGDVNGRAALQRGAAEAHGHTATASLSRQHAPPPQPAAFPPAASEAAASSPASLPPDILRSAELGELQKVVRWLRKGGAIDSLCSTTSSDGQVQTVSLLNTAATYGHLEMVRELLKRGASVDLPTGLGVTALMSSAAFGHLPILLLLLQHSASPNLQSSTGLTALMMATTLGNNEACVQALLGAKANTELVDHDGDTALQWAEITGHAAIAELLREHAAPPQPAAAAPAAAPDAGEPTMSSPASLPLDILRSAGKGELPKVVKWLRKGGAIDSLGSFLNDALGVALCAALPPTWSWVALSVVLGAIGVVATRRTLAARPGQDRAARQRRLHRTARSATAQGQTSTGERFRQLAAPPQLATVAASHTLRAEQAAQAWVGGATEEPQVEEAAEHQAPSKKSKKKSKAGRATATADEPSEAPPTTAPPPAAAPEPAVSAAERAEAALRAAIASGGLSALEAALAAAPREVREGGVGVEARARRGRLLEAQQEAEREAEQAAAAEAARLAAAERAREAAAQEAARVAAAAEAREEAMALAAALAVATAKADALERATAGGGDGGGSGTAGPSEASEAAVPDQLVCPITAEIMTDPVNTVRLALSLIASRYSYYAVLWPGPRPSHHTLPVSRTRAGRRPYVRAQRHRAVARDPQHLAHDRPRAGQQAAHPEPLPSQPHPRVTRARPLKQGRGAN